MITFIDYIVSMCVCVCCPATRLSQQARAVAVAVCPRRQGSKYPPPYPQRLTGALYHLSPGTWEED